MGQVSFTTLNKRDLQTGRVFSYVRFTRETTGKNGKIYDIDIHSDGSESYHVNSRRVVSFPDLPSVRELRQVVEAVKDDAMAMLAHEYNGPDYREAWWALKKKVESL